jgi:hypothetical protein
VNSIVRSTFSTALASAIFCCLAAGMTLAAESASKPAASAPATSSAPAGKVDPAIDKILDRLERKGDTVDSIEAAIEFTKIDPALDETQEYKGILRFKQAKPNPRFFIRFDEHKQDKVVRQKKQWHVFDGQWYIETRDDSNVITKRQVVRPGETLEVFKLGRGPFPLPFGQKKADILKHFSVVLVPSTPKDPPQTDHLACTPLPNTDLAKKYATVHFHIDKTLDLPVRVQTVEKEEGKEIIASFSSIKLNTGMVASQLDMPDMPDKQIDTIPLEADAKDGKGG